MYVIFEKNKLEFMEELWHKGLVSSEMDGLIPLLNLFNSEDDFIIHFFKNVKFFHPEIVKEQSKKLLENIAFGKEIPVRYSMKTFDKFHYANDKVIKEKSRKSFKNKEDAKKFALSQAYFHNDTGIRIVFDKDGNYFVRNEIYQYYNYRVSQGAISDVKNYMISHIWAKTDNPYFFTSFWNIALIPNYLSFILDKPDENSAIVRKIKLISRAICFKLYKPNNFLKLGKDAINEQEILEALEKEKISISNLLNNINYFEKSTIKNVSVEKILIDTIEDVSISRELKNKEFIFDILNNLKISKTNFVHLFESKEICKESFNMNYPILVDISNDSIAQIKQKIRPLNSDVYYSKSFFDYNNRKYLVTNDWYIEKRELLMEWLIGKVE